MQLTETQLQGIIQSAVETTLAQLKERGYLPADSSSSPVDWTTDKKAIANLIGISKDWLPKYRKQRMVNGIHYRCLNQDTDSEHGLRYEYHIENCKKLATR